MTCSLSSTSSGSLSLTLSELMRVASCSSVMNQLDPIKELNDMYSEEEDTLRIVELGDNRLDFVSDVEGPVS